MWNCCTVLQNNIWWQHVHTYSSLWFSAFRKFAPATAFDTLYNMVTLGFHYLFLLVFCHIMHIYIALHVQNLIHVLSIVIQQNLWSHSLLCCTFYIHVSAYICYNIYMSFFVAVVHGSFCICKSWFSVILPCLICCFPVRSICSHQISMYTFFFVVFMHVRHVARDSLQIALWHLMFCSSFSFIWLTIVFCPYFVLSKVRNLSVGTVLEWIHFCCGSLEVNLMCDATLLLWSFLVVERASPTIPCHFTNYHIASNPKKQKWHVQKQWLWTDILASKFSPAYQDEGKTCFILLSIYVGGVRRLAGAVRHVIGALDGWKGVYRLRGQQRCRGY